MSQSTCVYILGLLAVLALYCQAQDATGYGDGTGVADYGDGTGEDDYADGTGEDDYADGTSEEGYVYGPETADYGDRIGVGHDGDRTGLPYYGDRVVVVYYEVPEAEPTAPGPSEVMTSSTVNPAECPGAALIATTQRQPDLCQFDNSEIPASRGRELCVSLGCQCCGTEGLQTCLLSC